MKAAIEQALSNVTQHGNSDKCLEVSGDSQWTKSMNEFRRKRFVLFAAVCWSVHSQDNKTRSSVMADIARVGSYNYYAV